MSKPTRIYPVKGFYLNTTPHIEQVVETRAEADELIATGAFTDDPRHPDRLREETPETPADAGVPDSSKE